MRHYIGKLSNRMTQWVGSIEAIVIAVASIVVFVVVGVLVGFGETYQIVGNTVMSSVSYLILFIIQHTQNHDSKSLHIKVDELIKSIKQADNRIVLVEDLDEQQLSALYEKYKECHTKDKDLADISAKSLS